MKGIIIFLTIFTFLTIAILKFIGLTFKAIFRGIFILLVVILLISIVGALLLTIVEKTIGYFAAVIISIIIFYLFKK